MYQNAQDTQRILKTTRNYNTGNFFQGSERLGLFVDKLKIDELKTNRTKYAHLLHKSSLTQDEIQRMRQLDIAYDLNEITQYNNTPKINPMSTPKTKKDIFLTELNKYERKVSNKSISGAFYNNTVYNGQGWPSKELSNKKLNRIELLKNLREIK